MLIKQVIQVYDLLDRADASGKKVKEYMESLGAKDIILEKLHDEDDTKTTDYIRITIPGKNGKVMKGNSPTLGVLGRLGGIGARPEVVGYVSDGDGALAALAVAAKLLEMQLNGD